MTKINYNISVNKLNKEKTKTLKDRVLISIFIAIYYILFIVFSYLSDSSSTWSPIHDANNIVHAEQIKGVFAFCLMILFYLPLFFATKEINYLIFGKNKVSLIWLLITTFIFYFSPNISYLVLNYYKQTLIDLGLSTSLIASTKTIYLFVTTIVFSIFLNIIVCNSLLKYYKLINFKNVITLNFLIFLVPYGFMSLCFLGIVKSWFVLLFVFLIVVSTDVFCYFSGLFFGKKKMSPVISPNKTWEGAIGGFLITFLLAMIYCYLFTFDNHAYGLVDNSFQSIIGINLPWNISWLYLALISILMIVFSILGDLLFSYIKRAYSIKDYSNSLKSHGGILDRTDSLIFSTSIFTTGLFFITALSSSTLFG